MEVQEFLAQIYTNSALRKRFFTHPESVGKELNLSDLEIQELSQLSEKEVNLFAISLQRKRLGEVRDLLPLTNQVLGSNFKKLFKEYVETYLPQGIRKHQDDAIAFAAFMEKSSLTEDWILDVIKYEKFRIKVNNPEEKLIINWYNYDINTLIHSLIKGEKEPLLKRKKTLNLWCKISEKLILDWKF